MRFDGWRRILGWILGLRDVVTVEEMGESSARVGFLVCMDGVFSLVCLG